MRAGILFVRPLRNGKESNREGKSLDGRRRGGDDEPREVGRSQDLTTMKKMMAKAMVTLH